MALIAHSSRRLAKIYGKKWIHMAAACKRAMSSNSSMDTFKYQDIRVEYAMEEDRKTKPDPEKLLFGKVFTDHMLEVEWAKEGGWKVPKVVPFHNLSLHPATSALHYAIQLFEGMKAYRGVDGKIRMFRPDQNAERMKSTAQRLSLPDFSAVEFIKCLSKLLEVDQEWVPYSTSSSLYLRPTMLGMEPALGVSMASKALIYVIMCPVGPYFPTGSFTPISLYASKKFVRSCYGGVGNYKVGGNYAPTIHPQQIALENKCQQVLWLYEEQQYLTEVGTMNIFMYWVNEQGEQELITPPLDGLILPGVTRRSLLELARDWGEFRVTEGSFTMAQVQKAANEGRLKEMFGAGTACIVSPINGILYEGEQIDIPTMDNGAPVSSKFFNTLTDIQFGRIPNEWAVNIEDYL